MKKINAFISLLVLLLVLTGCASEDLSTRTFELEQNGVKTTMIYYFDGDKVKKQTTENVIDYAVAGLTSKEEAEAIFGPIVAEFQNIKGLTHQIEYGDTQTIEKMSVDYEAVDFAQMRTLPGMSFDGNAESKGISMKQSAEMIEQQGFTEVK